MISEEDAAVGIGHPHKRYRKGEGADGTSDGIGKYLRESPPWSSQSSQTQEEVE
jgi:hypothetical protein